MGTRAELKAKVRKATGKEGGKVWLASGGKGGGMSQPTKLWVGWGTGVWGGVV